MVCGDVGLQISIKKYRYKCINLFRHVGNLSNLAFLSSVFLPLIRNCTNCVVRVLALC